MSIILYEEIKISTYQCIVETVIPDPMTRVTSN